MLALFPLALPAQSTLIQAEKAPATILILRHAEKPADTGPIRSPDLTPVGYQRADALPRLFTGPNHPLPRPDYLFATARSKHSNRPVETITPLSQALQLPINHDFNDEEYAALAHEILSGRYAGKVVLIAWHHGQAQHVAQALGVPDAPAWNETVFNQIWKLQYTNGVPHLTVFNQHLLPGDADQPTP